MTSDEPDQEVWITLRLKGSMPLSSNADHAAGHLVKRIEAFLLETDEIKIPTLWEKIFRRQVRDHAFSLSQPAEIIEIEEESEIYDTEQTVF
jgi:hypothetical protein